MRDKVICELFEAALADKGLTDLAGQVALVAHGGYGRCDVAPFSDVDLMLLHTPAAASRVAPLADRILRDVFDTGLQLGHSVRTPQEAVRLALDDSSICTSLMESRLVAGNASLFEKFWASFERQVRQRGRALSQSIEQARREERLRYGETVFLLEPNVKRSGGTLRGLQLLRWIGFARYGAREPDQLHAMGVLSAEDLEVVLQAAEFLLHLRNEMHFHAGRATDVLSRAEQLRIAEVLGYRQVDRLRGVEQFMRDYFRHTNGVSHVVSRFVAKARSRDQMAKLATAVFGHRVEGGVRVGIAGLTVSRQGLALLRGNLTEIMRLVALANLYDKPIAPAAWEVIRREAVRLPDELPAAACQRFLSLLDHPARLGTLLRDLHDVHVLERFIPEFAHAWGLLQFNQYHKYTVDEHCLRAVEFATDLLGEESSLGRVYGKIQPKRLLHLALLIHDLGKGLPEDHRTLAVQIAQHVGARLALPSRDVESLKFLAGNHQMMGHFAFRRDTSDERAVVDFASQVGSPELLRMLYVMTASDLGAVGPGVWDGWKSEVLADLYRRTMQYLAGDLLAVVRDDSRRQQREAVLKCLGSAARLPWFTRHAENLPSAYLATTPPKQVAEDLGRAHNLQPGQVTVSAQYMPDVESTCITVETFDTIASGIFHKLTGALGSHALQIRSAQIHTLGDGLVLDRFWAYDGDYPEGPPHERLEEVRQALIESLLATEEQPPTFRRIWQSAAESSLPAADIQTRVRVDNTTSHDYTILDVFARNRPGLLYGVARALFERGLSVARAKIGTHQDQVIDVFYVTDADGRKIIEEPRLESIRAQLTAVVASIQAE